MINSRKCPLYGTEVCPDRVKVIDGRAGEELIEQDLELCRGSGPYCSGNVDLVFARRMEVLIHDQM
jgi:hypothetical protein